MSPESWLFAIMLSLAPPEKMAALSQYPGHEETAVQKTTRYASIAHDIAAVAWDPREAPIDVGKRGRLNTAALLLSVSFFESGWAHDADVGPTCYRGRDGKGSRCDGGRSVSIFQLQVGAGSTAEGWDRATLFSDREKAVRAALHRINRSIRSCAKFGADARLRQYASGNCEHGIPESAARIQFARDILRRFPAPPFDVPKEAPAPPVVSVVESPVYARAEDARR